MNRQDQEYVMSEFIHGTADEDALELLLEELRQNPELKQQLASQLLIEHSLYAKHDDSDGDYMRKEILNRIQNESSGRFFANATIERIKHATPARKTTRSHRRKPVTAKSQSDQTWWIVAAAAALFFVILALWPSTTVAPSTITEKPLVVELAPERVYGTEIGTWNKIHSNDLQHPSTADQRSNRCFIGDIVRSSSEAILILDDQSVITIESNSILEIKGTAERRELHLQSGTLSAHISKQSNDSAILFPTPHGTSRIVGTEFRLHSQQESSRLDVFSGKIEQSHLLRKESVFVESGQFVEIIPDQPLLVQEIEKAPEPVAAVIPEEIILPPTVVREPPVIETPFYEWSVSKPLSNQWIHGTQISNGANKVVASVETHEQHIIYARLEQDEREPLLATDEFHFTVKAKQALEIQVEIFLADNNPETPSISQVAIYSFHLDQAATGQEIPFQINLTDMKVPSKTFISNNLGCFAIRLTSKKDCPFELHRALIKRIQ